VGLLCEKSDGCQTAQGIHHYHEEFIMKLTIHNIIQRFATVAVAAAFAVSAHGQTPGDVIPDTGLALAADSETPGYALLAPDLLEAFLDGTITTAMEDHHLPGVTVSVVQNGKLVLAKGYGLARTNPPQPVVADQTLFRIGSISKTFTFSGVMQLVEKGMLDLDADIETILDDVRIEDRFGKLTMTDLMTHSAGFEDAYFGFFYADDIEDDLSSTDYLNQYAPHRVRPTGEQIVYSNFGVDLAGKVVESASGERFADYMDTHIFQPLGMTRSSFLDYPNQVADGYLDPVLEKDRAIGYRWAGGKFVPYDQFFIHTAQYPSGSVSATATDMAVFMLAHLNGGAIDGKRILAAETVEQMHTRLRSNADGIQGNAHGFWTGQIRGYRTVEHGGAVSGFLSDMVLIPELGLGIFVSTNGDTGNGSTSSLTRRIIENFYPPLTSPLQPDPGFSAQSKVYSGQYLGNRRGYEIIDKLASLGSEITVSITDEGYLITTSPGGSKRWLPVGNHVFENAEDGSRMAFEVDSSGIATRLYSAYGHNVSDRVSLPGSSQFFYVAAGSTLVLAFGSLFGFWLRRGRRPIQTGGEKLASYGVGITSLVWLLFFASFAALMSGAIVPEPEILVRYPTPLAWVTHLSATAAAMLVVVGVFGLLPVWRAGSWPFSRRLRHTVVVISWLPLVWALNDWNLLGLRYLGP
jgi:CubicO group peptidase (beta-lactamase class C family)